MRYLERYIAQTGGLRFLGYWDAATNTPPLSSSIGENGYYVVSQAGMTVLDQETDWQPKDWAVFSSGVWRKIDNTDKTEEILGIECDNFTLSYQSNNTLASVTFYSSPALTQRIALVSFQYDSALRPTVEVWTYYALDGVTPIQTVTYSYTWSGNSLVQRKKTS